jgi:3-hydroxyisobutyrate dehydrogenase-like beta-hydroxyacid dehydrogenase
MTTVAVVGTGRMGSAMARSLARGGVDLVLHNRSAERAEALANELGASLAGSPSEAASAADITITMLADGPAVEATWGGRDGLIAGARSGSVLVDMSTVPPETLPTFADAVHRRGAGIVDAPVSGSVQLAESASSRSWPADRPRISTAPDPPSTWWRSRSPTSDASATAMR